MGVWRIQMSPSEVEILYDDHAGRFSCGKAEPTLPPTMALEWVVTHAQPGDLLVAESGWVYVVMPDATE